MIDEVDIEPWNDVTPAAWIRPRLRPFKDFSAGSVIPTGFESYARIDNETFGHLGEATGRALVAVLVRHTRAPGMLWLAVWNGFGGIYGDDSRSVWLTARWVGPGDPVPPVTGGRVLREVPRRNKRDPLIRHENRDFLLYRGRPDVVPGWMDGPNLWWPDDRSWCVASEIDLPWTYVGGSAALMAEVLSNAEIPAQPLSLDESTLARDHPELGEPT